MIVNLITAQHIYHFIMNRYKVMEDLTQSSRTVNWR